MNISILYVEDDEVLRECFVDLLSEEFKIKAVANVEQALAFCEENSPDLLIADYKLGRETAAELLAKLVEMKNRPTRVLVFSARSQVDLDTPIFKSFKAVWLQKPVAYEKIKVEIEKMMLNEVASSINKEQL